MTGAGIRLGPRPALLAAGCAALAAAMALDTTVVRIGSPADVAAERFSPASFGAATFPKVRALIEARAVDAATLAGALARDQAAAASRYGVASDAGPEFCVRFTGVAARTDSGDWTVAVPGMPAGTAVGLQLGPAVLGTDLRDATGSIGFGQFRNQIEYQNAGAALNGEMKRAVLAGLDPARLAGRTVSVVGAFQLTDPGSWQVTPVRLEVR